MADLGSLPSPKEKYRRPTSSFLSSPRLFTSMVFSETEAVMSPTSILDSRPFSGLRNPFWSEASTPKTPELQEHKRLWDKLDSKGIVDALTDDQSDPKLPKPESRMVLFGSMLKIQIPPLLVSPAESPKSPDDFSVKTGNSQSPVKKYPFGSQNSGIETPNSPGVFTGCLSVSEMELSEDYTCVITHGPNPRTTHIFDNCIIESCCGVLGFSASKKQNGIFSDRSSSSSPPSSFPSESFLSFCHNCKKHLGQGEDIYMYRGEKAFCSEECRCQEMLLEEEGADGLDIDDGYGSCSL